MAFPALAASSRYSRNASELLAFVEAAKLDGIEYTIKGESHAALKAEEATLRELASSGVPIRHHLQFKDIERAHPEAAQAEASLTFLRHCTDVVAEMGGTWIVTHLGLGFRKDPARLNREAASSGLSRFVDYARTQGVEVCLENLPFGLVSTPEEFIDLLEQSGASATVDIGHAVASPCVLEGRCDALRFITDIPRLASAHVYDRELEEADGRIWHRAPADRACFEDRVRALHARDCAWWCIELGDPTEIRQTADLVRAILRYT